MRTVDILVKARNILKRRGWAQGRYETCGRGFCALGAMYKACNVAPSFNQKNLGRTDLDRAGDYLESVIGYEVAVFNDAPGRLKGEVILAFDKAIKNARRRHIRGD